MEKHVKYLNDKLQDCLGKDKIRNVLFMYKQGQPLRKDFWGATRPKKSESFGDKRLEPLRINGIRMGSQTKRRWSMQRRVSVFRVVAKIT